MSSDDLFLVKPGDLFTPTTTATSSPTTTATSSPTTTATSSPTSTATSSQTSTATSSQTSTATSSQTTTATPQKSTTTLREASLPTSTPSSSNNINYVNIKKEEPLSPGYIVLIVTCSVLLVLLVIVVLCRYRKQRIPLEPRNVSSFDNPVYNGEAEREASNNQLYQPAFIDSENEEGYQNINPTVIQNDQDYLDVNPPSVYSDDAVFSDITHTQSDL